MEDEKSYDLLSINWRNRKASGVNQSQFKGPSIGEEKLMAEALLWVQRLENQECCWCSRTGENSIFQREQTHTFPTFLFCSNAQWLDDAHPHQWKWFLLSLQIQILVSSGDTFRDTSRNNISPAIWTSFSPIILTNKLNHHNPCEVLLLWHRLSNVSKFTQGILDSDLIPVGFTPWSALIITVLVGS